MNAAGWLGQRTGWTGQHRRGTGMTVVEAVDGLPRRISGWAVGSWLAPTSMTGISVALGLVAAVWFTAGTMADSSLGAIVLCGSYLSGRSARGLAGPLVGSWAQTAGERRIAQAGGITVESAVVATLAVGGAAAGEPGLWRLAIIVLILTAIRQVAGACSDPAQTGREQEASLEGLIWRILALPPGGQMLLVAVIAPVWGYAAALAGLACWAIVAIASMLVSRHGVPQDIRSIVACRDDGPLASWLGQPVRGQLVPLPPALTGLAAASVLAILGLRDLPGFLLLAPVVAMLLASVGSSHPHDGRLDWIVPALLQAGQYVFIAAAGLASGVPSPVIFSLCALIALHYADLSVHAQVRTALGWEGRMLAAGLGAALGLATFAYVLLAAYVGWLISRELRTAGAQRWKETAGDRYGPGGRRGAQAPA
ncbi:MAG: DUF5941 domain-containing protein [Actinomycetota bacterium]